MRTKQAADRAGIAASTVRAYAREWADYLSPTAAVSGETRQFTADDVALFRTIKAMRDKGANTAEIQAVLDAGERLELPPEPPEPPTKAAKSDTGATIPAGREIALADELDRATRPWREWVEKLEAQLAEERAARLAAEVEAAELRGRMARRPWWKFWEG